MYTIILATTQSLERLVESYSGLEFCRFRMVEILILFLLNSKCGGRCCCCENRALNANGAFSFRLLRCIRKFVEERGRSIGGYDFQLSESKDFDPGLARCTSCGLWITTVKLYRLEEL